MSSRMLDLIFSALGSRSPQNEFKNDWFEHFLPMAPQVDKMSSRMIDLSHFCPWLQKSTKGAPELWIWALSYLGSRSIQNELQKYRFSHFLAVATEVFKRSTRSIFEQLTVGFAKSSVQVYAHTSTRMHTHTHNNENSYILSPYWGGWTCTWCCRAQRN